MYEKHRISGVIHAESNIAYLLQLPSTSDGESNAYLQDLEHRFLSFLKKQSKKPCDHVRFGGLRLEKGILYAAFCPFQERDYRPVARLVFDETGSLTDVIKEKRSRRKSP